MLTRLLPRSTRCGSAAAQVCHVSIRFTSTTIRHRSAVVVSQVLAVITPALATAASSPPSWATPSSTAVANAAVSRTSTTSVTAGRPCFSTSRAASSRSSGSASGYSIPRQRRADVDQDQVGAFSNLVYGLSARFAAGEIAVTDILPSLNRAVHWLVNGWCSPLTARHLPAEQTSFLFGEFRLGNKSRVTELAKLAYPGCHFRHRDGRWPRRRLR